MCLDLYFNIKNIDTLPTVKENEKKINRRMVFVNETIHLNFVANIVLNYGRHPNKNHYSSRESNISFSSL